MYYKFLRGLTRTKIITFSTAKCDWIELWKKMTSEVFLIVNVCYAKNNCTVKSKFYGKNMK